VSSQDPSSVEPARKNCGLSRLEKQAIALIASGYSREEIAMKLGIEEPTLRRHISGVCDKLGVSNEFELLLHAVYHGLAEIDKT